MNNDHHYPGAGFMKSASYVRVIVASLVCASSFVASAAAQEQPKAPFDPRAAAQDKFGDSVEMRFDVPYAGTDNPRQALDLYLPKHPAGAKPLPLVVFIHGGGWSGGDKAGYIGPCTQLAATGEFVCASVGYRLSGETKWPSQIHDCKAAVRWLRAHAAELNVDPDKIGATGGSAGGHLVTLLGLTGDNAQLEGEVGEHTGTSSRVTCVINFCGPQDMGAPLMQGDKAKVDDPAVAGLVGGPLAEHAAAVKECSPLTYVSDKAVPIMTVHGTKDARVDFKHAQRLDAALKQAGTPTFLVAMEGAGHGIPVGPELAARMLNFWKRYLYDTNAEVSTDPIVVEAEATK